MTRREKIIKLAKISPKTYTNWCKNKQELIKALNSYLDFQEYQENWKIENKDLISHIYKNMEDDGYTI